MIPFVGGGDSVTRRLLFSPSYERRYAFRNPHISPLEKPTMSRVKVLVTGRVGHPDQRSGSYSLEKGEIREDLPDEVVEVCVHVSDPPRVEVLDDVVEPDVEPESDQGDQPESKASDGGTSEREAKSGRGLFGKGRARKGEGDGGKGSQVLE